MTPKFIVTKHQALQVALINQPLKRNRLNGLEDMTTSEGGEKKENIPLEFIMDKLDVMEARIEDNLQMGEVRYEFQTTTDWWREESVKEIKKSLENAWAAIEDV